MTSLCCSIRIAVILSLCAGCYSGTLLDAVKNLIPEKPGKPPIRDILGNLTSGSGNVPTQPPMTALPSVAPMANAPAPSPGKASTQAFDILGNPPPESKNYSLGPAPAFAPGPAPTSGPYVTTSGLGNTVGAINGDPYFFPNEFYIASVANYIDFYNGTQDGCSANIYYGDAVVPQAGYGSVIFMCLEVQHIFEATVLPGRKLMQSSDSCSRITRFTGTDLGNAFVPSGLSSSVDGWYGSPDFLPIINFLNDLAIRNGVQLVVTSGARSGAISSELSPHLVGHAIDFNVRTPSGVYCNGACMLDPVSTGLTDPSILNFLNALQKASEAGTLGLRWGKNIQYSGLGTKGGRDPVHVDDAYWQRHKNTYASDRRKFQAALTAYCRGQCSSLGSLSARNRVSSLCTPPPNPKCTNNGRKLLQDSAANDEDSSAQCNDDGDDVSQCQTGAVSFCIPGNLAFNSPGDRYQNGAGALDTCIDLQCPNPTGSGGRRLLETATFHNFIYPINKNETLEDGSLLATYYIPFNPFCLNPHRQAGVPSGSQWEIGTLIVEDQFNELQGLLQGKCPDKNTSYPSGSQQVQEAVWNSVTQADNGSPGKITQEDRNNIAALPSCD